MYVKNNDVIYFDSFGVEHVPKEIYKLIGNKDNKTNIFRIQAYNSIMCGYFCTGFIDFMFANKTGNKDNKTNIFRIQAYNSIMCGYFCTGFIDFMFANKTLIILLAYFLLMTFKKMIK